jgi:Tfp pilus assembly protein PilF
VSPCSKQLQLTANSAGSYAALNRLNTVRLSLILVISPLCLGAVVRAQTLPQVDTLAEARRLRDAGDYAAAAAMLAPYVGSHPGDAGSARFGALMAYWSKDFGSARAIYEHALERHPTDADLRVEYARFLMDLGETSRSRDVITPLVDSGPRLLPATRRALTLLGTLDYWRGDFSRARRRFIETLRLDSTDADARRQLREIELASASWVGFGMSAWDDDQPLRHFAADAEGGWFATPLTPLSLRVRSTGFDTDAATERLSLVEGTFATYLPAAHLDVGLGGGVLQRSFGDAADWTGRLTLGVRLAKHTTLEGKAERAPYVNTASSLETAVMTETLQATAKWSHGGWLGEAAARRESFEDDNAVATGYVWLLAPMLWRPTGGLQLGYSFAAQSATDSRFVPRSDAVPFPPGQAPSGIPGVYDPYYTPRNLRANSALVAATMRPNARWSITANGAYGFHARDDAPVLVTVLVPPNVTIVRSFYDRDFTPWNVRGGVEGAVTDAVRLALTGERGRAAYYSFTTVGVRLTYTFTAAARRRADRY